MMLDALQAWVEAGWLRELDVAFARFLAREVPDADPLLLAGAALASHQLGRGHVALDLAALVRDAGDTLALPPEDARKDGDQGAAPVEPAMLLAGVDLARWRTALNDARLVAGGEGDTPLVLQGERLYLRRFWSHEQSVREGIQQRLVEVEAGSDQAQSHVRAALDALFPTAGEIDWQKAACALALRTRFAIVTGGPGTGKTTTVVKLLALLQHLSLSGAQGDPRRLRIRLAAPTGKAAARLQSSIAGAIAKLPLQALAGARAEAVRAAIPTDVSTVHRLLGSLGGTRRFRHGADNPLPLDVLVLDEASMIDLETMAAVMAALPARGRVVLLGDKDQLASVEAGNVLGELCRGADEGHYLPRTRDWLQAVSGERIPAELIDTHGEALDQVVVKLRRSWRFDADSGIGQLADAVNRGDGQRARELRGQARSDLSWLELDARDAALRRLVLDGAADGFASRGGEERPVGYRHYLQVAAQAPGADATQEDLDDWARKVLKAYGAFQLLCAVRRGPHGVEGLNRRIATLLHSEKLTSADTGWYAGRPVMVTHNDYALGLMNGDVGIALPMPMPAPDDPQRPLLRVAFEGTDGSIRWILPSRLREIETVFAMTVHKSQGSEFEHAALLLPEVPSRVLTRELVYTGVTRAKNWFTLAVPQSAYGVLDTALARRTRQYDDGPRLTGRAHEGGIRP